MFIKQRVKTKTKISYLISIANEDYIFNGLFDLDGTSFFISFLIRLAEYWSLEMMCVLIQVAIFLSP